MARCEQKGVRSSKRKAQCRLMRRRVRHLSEHWNSHGLVLSESACDGGTVGA